MAGRSHIVVLFLLLIPAFAQEGERPRWVPNLTLQTGFASTFQMNLGGTFGGPAWQNRATAEYPQIFNKNDALTLTGFNTLDTQSGRFDWTMGAAYRFPAWRKGNQGFVATAGWQHWLLPSVGQGMNDQLIAGNALYRTKVKVPVLLTVDDWQILASHSRRGNLVLLQATLVHTLWTGTNARKIVLRHGPSSSYSYHFWNREGWRMFRYGGSLAYETKPFILEAAFRQQAHIAPLVPDNQYWTVMLSRRF
jgi:hypothetical protein